MKSKGWARLLLYGSLSLTFISSQLFLSPLALAASSLGQNPNHGPISQSFSSTYYLPSPQRCSTPYVSFAWDGIPPRSGVLLGTLSCSAATTITGNFTPPGGSSIGGHIVYAYFSNSSGGNSGIDTASASYTIDAPIPTPTPSLTPTPTPNPTPTPTPTATTPPPPTTTPTPTSSSNSPLPTVTTVEASDITPYTAKLNGNLEPHGCTLPGGGLGWSFIVGQTTNYGLKAPSGGINPTLTSVVPISGVMTGLTPNTLYHFELTAYGPCGGGQGTDLTFTTLPATILDLTATTGAATKIADHSATLNGIINPHGCPSPGGGGGWSFIMGTTTNYGLAGPGGIFTPNLNSDVAISGEAVGLLPSTLYHYQLTAAGPCGTGGGVDMTFTTASAIIPPATVTTLPATKVTDHSVTLNGSVNPHGCNVGVGGGSWSFVMGKTKNYGIAGPSGGFDPKLTTDIPVSGNMFGLDANTTYHYQLTAFVNCQTGNAEDLTFTTLPQINPNITVTTLEAKNITNTSAFLSGTIAPFACPSPAGGGTWSILYGTSSTYGHLGPSGFFDPKSNGVITKSGQISNLKPNTSYHFTLTAADGCGADGGKDLIFTTNSSSSNPPLQPLLILGGILGLGGLGFLAFKMGWLKF